MQLHFFEKLLGMYIGLYAVTNNYCIVCRCNDFYLPTTLIIILSSYCRLVYVNQFIPGPSTLEVTVISTSNPS